MQIIEIDTNDLIDVLLMSDIDSDELESYFINEVPMNQMYLDTLKEIDESAGQNIMVKINCRADNACIGITKEALKNKRFEIMSYNDWMAITGEMED